MEAQRAQEALTEVTKDNKKFNTIKRPEQKNKIKKKRNSHIL